MLQYCPEKFNIFSRAFLQNWLFHFPGIFIFIYNSCLELFAFVRMGQYYVSLYNYLLIHFIVHWALAVSVGILWIWVPWAILHWQLNFFFFFFILSKLCSIQSLRYMCTYWCIFMYMSYVYICMCIHVYMFVCTYMCIVVYMNVWICTWVLCIPIYLVALAKTRLSFINLARIIIITRHVGVGFCSRT